MSRMRMLRDGSQSSYEEPYHRCSLCGRDGRVLDAKGHCTMRTTCAKSVTMQSVHDRRARVAEIGRTPFCECGHSPKRHTEMDDGYCYAPGCDCTSFRLKGAE